MTVRGGAGASLVVTYVSLSALYTFTLYPYFIEGQATLRPLFEVSPLLLLILAPALTYDLVAALRQTGQLDTWLALPISYPLLLLGWLGGAWLSLCLAILLSCLIPLILSIYTEIIWGPIWTGMLGNLLTGTMYLCIGIWSSISMRSSLSAWFTALALCLISYVIGEGARFLPSYLGDVCQQMSVSVHHSRFTRGVIDSRDLIYFFGMILFWFTYAIEKFRAIQSTAPHLKERNDHA